MLLSFLVRIKRLAQGFTCWACRRVFRALHNTGKQNLCQDLALKKKA